MVLKWTIHHKFITIESITSHTFQCERCFSFACSGNFLKSITRVILLDTVPYKSYSNDSRFNRYNFGTVNAINFQCLTLHTTPFAYDIIDFGVLH